MSWSGSANWASSRTSARAKCAPSSASSATRTSCRPSRLPAIPGVEQVLPILKPFKLASREFHPPTASSRSFARQGVDVKIGGGHLAMIAGPCAIESDEVLDNIAGQVKAAGANILRGGAFKPRTSPYSFQGLGETGCRSSATSATSHGLPVVTEVMDPRQVETGRAATPTCSRSAPATCRTSTCSRRSARRACRCCSSAA